MIRPSHQRFPAGPVLGATLLLGLSACGGGGGSGDTTPPDLFAAALVTPTLQPQVASYLLLTFDEPVRAPLNTPIDAATFTLSAGGSFGAGAVLDSQPDPQSLLVLMGTGFSVTAGTTTIEFAPTNTVVADLSGNLGRPDNQVVIGLGDGLPPVLNNVTVADIDDALNGDGPAGGVLQLPPNGFPIDLLYADGALSGTPTGVNPTATRIFTNVAVVADGQSRPAGTNLTPFLTPVSLGATAARFLVPQTVVFPGGQIVIGVAVIDNGGLVSGTTNFTVTVRSFTDALRPFETTANPSQVWWLDLGRDVESYLATPVVGGAVINIQQGSNGRSDYVDILHILGLQTTTPQTNGTTDTNALARGLLEDAILAELAAFYTGCNVDFTYTQPAGSFGTTSSFPYGSFGYSQICIGGAYVNLSGVLGVAQFDPSNTRQNNDCLLESGVTTRLGVFVHTMAAAGFVSNPSSSFRTIFDVLAPVFGGNPIGTIAGDLQRLEGTLSDSRAATLDAALFGMARYIAVVTAHECGHSMGLVTDGPMPVGLYGNDPVNFPGSTSGHIKNEALFPAGSTNIMSPSVSFSLSNHPSTAFNSLNIAYLREQVFYGN